VVSRSGYYFPPFIALDRGVTLKEWLKEDRPASAVLTMAEEVLRLLELLHASDHVHRDLKPDNLLHNMSNQKWCLLDFGIVARNGVLSIQTFALRQSVLVVLSLFSSNPYVQICTRCVIGTRRLGLQHAVTMRSLLRSCSCNASTRPLLSVRQRHVIDGNMLRNKVHDT
jgi:serine/threonine protein kinase